MSKVVFLLEERSMKILLEGLLPRIMPGLHFQCIPHEGKNDLVKSIPRKLRAWTEPGVRFVVVQDNDGGNCLALKRHLSGLCESAGKPEVLVRIACQELEAWYFGELEAVALAFEKPDLAKIGKKSRYRDPDAIAKPSRELVKLVPEFQKIAGARKMALYLGGTENQSRSYRVFIEGVQRLIAASG